MYCSKTKFGRKRKDGTTNVNKTPEDRHNLQADRTKALTLCYCKNTSHVDQIRERMTDHSDLSDLTDFQKNINKLNQKLGSYITDSSLREKCLNTEFLEIQTKKNTDQKKLHIWTFFTQYISLSLKQHSYTSNKQQF